MAPPRERTHRKMRVISVIAATAISLACGTNYAYSAWAPQFDEKLRLSATQSNVIGTAANFGMYTSGIPMGIVTDRKSPRLAAVVGMLALGLGYFPIHRAYENGAGSLSVAAISFFSFLTGVGSCSAFQAALKIATLNWPTHRGTATAFPLAAFGLSAFFYTFIAGFAFPGDTGGFLLLLSLATPMMILISIPFLQLIDHQRGAGYSTVPATDRPRRNSNRLHRTKSDGGKHSRTCVEEREPSKSFSLFSYLLSLYLAPLFSGQPSPATESEPEQARDSDENSSLLSIPGDIVEPVERTHGQATHRSHVPDVTGLALLKHIEFWQLWVLLGLLAGVGLMTINNMGHNVQALWNHYDDSASNEFVANRQLMHVSIISICSFLGRLISGIGSDIIVKRLHMSRFWCAAVSATVFMFAQLCATRIEDPHVLWAVSGLSGLAYGMLFGVFPALVVDAFGAAGFAVNWGFMTLAPAVSGNIYNLFYGAVYDAHSDIQPGGDRSCAEGLACYRTAYYVTFVSSAVGILTCLWGIMHAHAVKKKGERDHDSRYEA